MHGRTSRHSGRGGPEPAAPGAAIAAAAQAITAKLVEQFGGLFAGFGKALRQVHAAIAPAGRVVVETALAVVRTLQAEVVVGHRRSADQGVVLRRAQQRPRPLRVQHRRAVAFAGRCAASAGLGEGALLCVAVQHTAPIETWQGTTIEAETRHRGGHRAHAQ
ncbi:MAG: hypothetical protein JNM25_06930 [Planctomycetes bacterium]|nr:hypothetical protein [Planctomycetota bacterium]